MQIKIRPTLWIIAIGLVAAINISVLQGAYDLAKYLGLGLIAVATKLTESEEASAR